MKTTACSLLAGILALTAVHAAGPAADPFVREVPEARPAVVKEPQVLSVRFETFSLDLADAAALYRKMTSDTALYDGILDRLAKGKAKQEGFTVVRTRSGERSISEAISEFIYPTEFEAALTFNQFSLTRPEEVPSPVPVPAAGGIAAQQKYFAPVRPSSFETRNVGFTLEVEATLAENQPVVDLRLAPDYVTLVDRAKWGQGISETELPVFETQRTTTATTLKLGMPHLVSTMNRPPASKIDADAANRIWFAFVTVDLVIH